MKEWMVKLFRTRGFEKISREQFHNDFNEVAKLEKVSYFDISRPTRSTAKSAGYDIAAPFSFTLEPGEEIKLPTGLKAYMKKDEYLGALPRSGHGFKYYLRLANTEGIIDSDYYNNPDNEGHIWIKIRNEGTKTLHVRAGDGICQAIFKKYLLADGDSFTGKTRLGGFGKNGKGS